MSQLHSHSFDIDNPIDEEGPVVEIVVTFTHIPGYKGTYDDPPEGPENEIQTIEMLGEDGKPMLYPVVLERFLAEQAQDIIDNLGEYFYRDY